MKPPEHGFSMKVEEEENRINPHLVWNWLQPKVKPVEEGVKGRYHSKDIEDIIVVPS